MYNGEDCPAAAVVEAAGLSVDWVGTVERPGVDGVLAERLTETLPGGELIDDRGVDELFTYFVKLSVTDFMELVFDDNSSGTGDFVDVKVTVES